MSVSNEAIMEILSVGEVKEYGSNGFKKATFVAKTLGDYPETFQIELHKDNTEKLQYLKVGDKKKICFNIRGNTWDHETKGTMYFTQLVAWGVWSVDNDESPSVSNEDVPSNIEEEIPF